MLCLHFPAQAADRVLITEFMASNDGIVLDEDGDSEDWIEIHNAGTNIVNLDGWSLTDKPSQLALWKFPATNIAPNAYIVVFASSKTAGCPAGSCTPISNFQATVNFSRSFARTASPLPRNLLHSFHHK
jgi:hypothetical protein